MLLGESAARKSTSIKIAKKVLTKAGYDTIAADKTSKEKFLLDLEGRQDEPEGGTGAERKYDKILEENLWGDSDNLPKAPREIFIMADEFNEFAGSGNLEFYTTLGNLWDWDDEARPFSQRLKNSRSVAIWQPTINMLGGNTQENYAKAFPPEIIGQGFLSRMLHIYGERNGKKIAFPVEPTDEATAEVITALQTIRGTVAGEAQFTEEAKESLGELYETWQPLEDVRFKSYSNRRFTQLLKLCLSIAAIHESRSITQDVIIESNTILSAAEHLMPRALGEFGKSRNSDVTNKIVEMLGTATRPLTAKDLWAEVYKDLEKISMLGDIMQGLLQAGRVQLVKGRGWLPMKAVARTLTHIDWNLLTDEERKML
jgi:hypothetical protein